MKRLTVHIGMHKTGTSSIQDSLAAGLDHPDHQYLAFGRPNGSLAIAQAFDDRFEKRPAVRNRKITPEQREQIRVRGLGHITGAFRNSSAPHGIVSAEDIRGLSRDALKKLFALFTSSTKDIQVVSYIREPRGLVESSFQQVLKAVAVNLGEHPFRVNYLNHFEKFDELVGRDCNLLWLFEPASFRNGDIVMDFCNRLGIPFDKSKVVRSNDGLSLDSVKMLWCYRLYNQKFSPSDKIIVDRLMELHGEKMSFSKDMLAKACKVDNKQVTAVEQRMQKKFRANGFDENPGNIRCLEDLEAVSPAGRDWLAKECRCRVKDVADAIGISAALKTLTTLNHQDS